MTREEKAVYYKHNGFNCCQSVIKAMINLSDSDKEILTNAASGFAAGMGGMEATCGADWSNHDGGNCKAREEKCDKTAREILNKFQEYSGATICKDLKGKDTGVVLCECDDCIRNAIRAFDEVLPMESEREGQTK